MYVRQVIKTGVASLALASLSVTAWAAGGAGTSDLAALKSPSLEDLAAVRVDKIDLLLTDMVMPGGLTGRQVSERLLAEDPALKVIYSSGYSPGMAGKDLALLQNKNFLPKPYCPSKLLETLRKSLDGPAN